MFPIDAPRVQATLDLLHSVSPAARLLQMKNLCVNNGGIWTVPDDPAVYRPALFEISLFGVPAIADTIEALPGNWLRAARNMLSGSV